MDFRTIFLHFSLLCAFITLVRSQQNVTVETNQFTSLSSGWFNPLGKRDCEGSKLMFTENIGSSFSLQFQGTAVYLFATMAWDRGEINVKLDGNDMGNVQTWLNTDNHDDWVCTIVWSSPTLAAGNHRMDVTLVGGHNGERKFEVGKVVYTGQPGAQPLPMSPELDLTASATATTDANSATETASLSAPEETSSQSEEGSTQTSADAASASSSTSQPSPQSAAATTPVSTANLPLKTADVSPEDPRILYSPADAWRAGNATACNSVGVNSRSASLMGATLTFNFKGTSIFLKTLGSSTGIYTVAIDGQPGDTINTAPVPNSACSGVVMGYNKTGLADTTHVLTVSVANATSTLLRRAADEFQFAGLQYVGADAIDTSSVVNPSNPSTSQPINGAAIGGGIGGALAALILIGLGVYWYLRYLKKRNLAPSAMYAKTMQTGSRNNHRLGVNTGHSRHEDPHQSFNADPQMGGFSQLESPQPSPEDPPPARWRPRSFAAISAWTASIGRTPNWTAPSPCPSTMPLPTSFQSPCTTDPFAQPPDALPPPPPSENPPPGLVGEKAMLYHVYNR